MGIDMQIRSAGVLLIPNSSRAEQQQDLLHSCEHAGFNDPRGTLFIHSFSFPSPLAPLDPGVLLLYESLFLLRAFEHIFANVEVSTSRID